MNEYTSVGGTTRAHSDNGNLRDDGRNTFVYDYKNRLIGAFDKATGNPTAAYLYYCDNRRAKKIVYSQASPGQVQSQERYFYDGSQVVEETDDPGNTLLTWVYSPVYVDEPVQMVRGGVHPLGTGTFYLHQNARADVVAVTDAAGAVVERRLFDDYGRAFDGVTKQAVSGSAVGNVYGFQGRRLDSETGLLYFRARYYDPATGRFVQRDPVWDPGNFGNQYSFVGNSPVSGRDPSGLEPGAGLLRNAKALAEWKASGRASPGTKAEVKAFQRAMAAAARKGLSSQGRRMLLRVAAVGVGVSGAGVVFMAVDGATSGYAAYKKHQARKAALKYGNWGANLSKKASVELKAFGKWWSRSNGALNASQIQRAANLFSQGRKYMEVAALLRKAEEEAECIDIPTDKLTTDEELEDLEEYVRRTNEWLEEAGPQVLVPTAGDLRRQASNAARRERRRAAREGTPYEGKAGHVPDTAVSNQADPPGGWLDMRGKSNDVAGGVLGSRIGRSISGFSIGGKKPD